MLNIKMVCRKNKKYSDIQTICMQQRRKCVSHRTYNQTILSIRVKDNELRNISDWSVFQQIQIIIFSDWKTTKQTANSLLSELAVCLIFSRP